jgi:mRNA interferase RelE/StbE
VTYSIEFTDEALADLNALARPLQKKLLARIEQLAETPVPHNAKKLKGYDTLYRIRFSEGRVVYDLLEDRLIVAVVRIGHRSTVYERGLQ